MAKAANNLVLHGVSGKLAGIVVRQMGDGSIRLSARPDFSNRRFSEAQKDHQKRFREASAYARRAAQTQPLYAELAQGTTKNAYNIALSDWFNPPVIHCVERRGETIRVEASDNVKVAKVQVQILDANGEVLEEGEAVQRDPELSPELWEYPSKAEGQLAAEAWDLAGNRTGSALS